MRLFLEALEILPQGSVLQGEFIRADITGKTDAEIAEIKALVQGIMFGLNYRLTMHECYHEEGDESCTQSIISH